VKYFITRNDSTDERLYRVINATDEIVTYENPYALSPGFIAPVEAEHWSSYGGNPFNTQNTLVNEICGVSDIFVPLKQKHGQNKNLTFDGTGTNYYAFKRGDKDSKSTARIIIEVEESGYVYLYLSLTGNMVDNGFVMVNDKKVEFNARRSTVANIGYCEAGDKVQFELSFKESAPESGNFKLLSYTMDIEKFKEAMSLIKENSMKVTTFTDNRISGTVTAKEDSLMIMTIPFDPGWRVKIDGNRAETKALDEGFLCFDLPAGEHNIELVFIPNKMDVGLIISLVSIVALILLYLYNRKHRDRMQLKHSL